MTTEEKNRELLRILRSYNAYQITKEQASLLISLLPLVKEVSEAFSKSLETTISLKDMMGY